MDDKLTDEEEIIKGITLITCDMLDRTPGDIAHQVALNVTGNILCRCCKDIDDVDRVVDKYMEVVDRRMRIAIKMSITNPNSVIRFGEGKSDEKK